MDPNWTKAFDDLGNRKGVALLVLATRALAIGPLLIFVIDRQLYMDLSTGKLLLMACAATMPAMVLASGFFIGFYRDGDKDKRALMSLALPPGIFTLAEIIAIGWIWLRGGGIAPFVVAQGLTLFAIVATEWSDHRQWLRDQKAKPLDATPHECRDFALSQHKRFQAWLIERRQSAT